MKIDVNQFCKTWISISLENLLCYFPNAALFENWQTFCNQLWKTCTIQANNHIHAICNWSEFIAQSTDWHRLKCIHSKFTAFGAYLWKTSTMEKATILVSIFQSIRTKIHFSTICMSFCLRTWSMDFLLILLYFVIFEKLYLRFFAI